MKLTEENKKTEVKETETEEQNIAASESEKKQDSEKNEGEQDGQNKDKEEAPKQPDRINIIPETHLQNLIATHNHALTNISKVISHFSFHILKPL